MRSSPFWFAFVAFRFGLACITCDLATGTEAKVESPDGRVVCTVGDEGGLHYRVAFAGKPAVVDSALGFDFAGDFSLGPKAEIQQVEGSEKDGHWENRFGKRRMVRDRYRQMRVALAEPGAPKRRFDLIVRAYDDGVAFRYDLPEQDGLGEFTILNERTEFAFAEDFKCWAGEPSSCAEGRYPEQRLSRVPRAAVLPVLVELPQGYAAIAESDLLDWAGMFLGGVPGGDGAAKRAALKASLAPRKDKRGLVVSQTPRVSPWRVILLAGKADGLISSDLIANLASPSRVEDVSWIKPGIAAWDIWWAKKVDARGTTETHNAYIDFAAEMGWPYQLVDWGWCESGDVTRWNPKVNIPELLAYAKAKGVRLLLWMHSKDLNKTGIEKAFSTVAGWGVPGVKIDFMNSDSQETVRWYAEVLEAAAKHRLMVNFHGAYKPTGLARTWPNYITQEGVLGNEYNKLPGKKCDPLHAITLPFTRGLLGPMDFTPGGFKNRTPEEFVTDAGAAKEGNCEVMGTRARQLAMTVVYESPILCVCDSPESYRNQPGLEFLRGLPTVWDETVVLSAEVAKHVVLARRKGDGWYLAAMNGDAPFEIDLALGFLEEGEWSLRGFGDTGESATRPEMIEEKRQLVTKASVLRLRLAPAGGFVAVLRPSTQR